MSDETCCGACGFPIYAAKERACVWCRQSADRIEALEAKLAENEVRLRKAVEALRQIADPISLSQGNVNAEIARATLASIKGESHEALP
ncbi:hypothetical protein UFOVP845_48 [uncultured Caudovirales phage]|uniref:Uncharacterized protein n=1 Tax=uncultured Caudovirales phage TaxID=2100421 RepID=A0A6J5P483_9CAUD|nr:hypothetical protein UFOVP845_48 [uncultured Caudovirales phage]